MPSKSLRLPLPQLPRWYQSLLPRRRDYLGDLKGFVAEPQVAECSQEFPDRSNRAFTLLPPPEGLVTTLSVIILLVFDDIQHGILDTQLPGQILPAPLALPAFGHDVHELCTDCFCSSGLPARKKRRRISRGIERTIQRCASSKHAAQVDCDEGSCYAQNVTDYFICLLALSHSEAEDNTGKGRTTADKLFLEKYLLKLYVN